MKTHGMMTGGTTTAGKMILGTKTPGAKAHGTETRGTTTAGKTIPGMTTTGMRICRTTPLSLAAQLSHLPHPNLQRRRSTSKLSPRTCTSARTVARANLVVAAKASHRARVRKAKAVAEDVPTAQAVAA
eukprot:8369924-Pyramimonas_sp.AAC.1